MLNENSIDRNSKLDIAAIVVWFNPSFDEVSNIETYLQNVSVVYIVDNSTCDNSELLKFISIPSKVLYFPRMNNLGIANALNYGCENAIKDGFKWVLTMDQDSYFHKLSIDKYISRFLMSEDDGIAIFAPTYYVGQVEGFTERVIASGNIVSLLAYQDVGGFDNELFIDEVDYDFCYRLTLSKYKIYVYGDVEMIHSLGESKCHRLIFNREVKVMHHSPTRKYYIFRNRLLMMKKYPKLTKMYGRDNIMLIFSILLFEKDKLSKLQHVIRGVLDYKKGKLGKIK